MNPRRTRRQALGQHFLHHRPTIGRIAALTDAELDAAAARGAPARALIEIGPGKLALTRPLAAIAAARQLPLLLVERDHALEDGIRTGISELDPSIEGCFMDAASESFGQWLEALAPRGLAPAYLTANLPYSAASQILAWLCRRQRRLAGAAIMIQKEVGARMAAAPGSRERGSFSLLVQAAYDVRLAFVVAPGAFSPPPKVHSQVLILRPKPFPATEGMADPMAFETFCKALFSQRRKMIRSLIPPEKHQLFPKLGISGTERPEALELATIVELYRSGQP